GRLVRPFHPGLSVWVTVHVFVLSFMFSLGGTFTLRAARLSLAHRILTLPPEISPSPRQPSAGRGLGRGASTGLQTWAAVAFRQGGLLSPTPSPKRRHGGTGRGL